MRIVVNKKIPQVGDRRTRSRFLWLPLVINKEFRWFEYAEWEELYCWTNTWFISIEQKWVKDCWVN